jgi:hypothetical protein
MYKIWDRIRIRIAIKTICRSTTQHSGDFQPILCVCKGFRGKKNPTFLTKQSHSTRPDPDPFATPRDGHRRWAHRGDYGGRGRPAPPARERGGPGRGGGASSR